MKNLFASLFFLTITLSPACLFSKENTEQITVKRYNSFKSDFEKAYAFYPSVPKGVLEAVAYTNSRFYHLTHAQSESCVGIPQAYTIMGLTKDGKGYFRNNLDLIASLSKLTQDEILTSPEKTILAYASAYDNIAKQLNITSNKIEDHVFVLKALSELPSNGKEQDYAFNSQMYAMLWFLNDKEKQRVYQLPNRKIDLEKVFGQENLSILRSRKITIQDGKITNEKGQQYQSNNKLGICQNYSFAIVDAADPSNYSSRSGSAITHFTIHDIQGSYGAAIAWFKNPSANVSTHYVIRSFDGQVTQMVCEADKAWHVTSSNPFTVGTEHEGYWDVPGWYTEAMYVSSADVVGNTLDTYGIDRKRTYDGPGFSGLQVLSNCYTVKGHQHYPSQTHQDPGLYWDWAHFYELLNPAFTISNTYTTATGNFYDNGGATGNYLADDRTFDLISPTGASSVTLNFTQFSLENNFDFLYIYDGTSNTDPLIGKYTSTNSPGTVIGNSGSLLVEFRSDCNTIDIGWEANWTANLSTSTCGMPTNLVVSNATAFTSDVNWNVVSGATAYSLRYKHHTYDTLWNYVYTAVNNYTITSLIANEFYEVHVAAICGNDTSAYVGANFSTTLATGHINTVVCSGTFKDAGGDFDYGNGEDYLYTIAPSGATQISMVFKTFNTETNYDYLYAYDGVDNLASSLGIFNGTANPGTVTSTGGSLTFEFNSDNSTIKSGWEANWYAYGGGCPAKPVSSITTNIWEIGNFTANYTDTDQSGTNINDAYYQVLSFNGTDWEANANEGFLNDNFTTTMNSHWVVNSGSWVVNSGELIQTDESNVNTNLYIPIEQDSSHSYLYSWNMKIEGTGSSKRAGIHIFSDAPTGVERGDSYLAWIREDAGTVQLWDNVNNADTLKTDEQFIPTVGQYYNYKLIYDPSTGAQTLYINDVIYSTWIDSTPHKTGQYISLRTRYCRGSFDDIKVYKSRNQTTTVSVGTTSNNEVNYQNVNPTTPSCIINTLSRDNNHHISTNTSQLINIDWTAPAAIVTINDGVGGDIDTTFAANFNANWTPSTDPHSGVMAYWYAIGTTVGGTDVINWTNNGLANSLNIVGSSLFINGQIYYVSVKAENGAGLFSNPVTSDGQLVIPDIATAIKNNEVENTAIKLYPNPTTGNFVIELGQVMETQITIVDVTGKEVYTIDNVMDEKINVSLDDFSNGVYFVKVQSNEQQEVIKLIKQ